MFCQSKNEGDILLRLRESILDCEVGGIVCCAWEEVKAKTSPNRRKIAGQLTRNLLL